MAVFSSAFLFSEAQVTGHIVSYRCLSEEVSPSSLTTPKAIKDLLEKTWRRLLRSSLYDGDIYGHVRFEFCTLVASLDMCRMEWQWKLPLDKIWRVLAPRTQITRPWSSTWCRGNLSTYLSSTSTCTPDTTTGDPGSVGGSS